MGPQVVGPLELVQKWSQKLPSTGMKRALILPEGIELFYRVLPLLWLLEAWLGLPWAGLDGLWAVHDGLHHLCWSDNCYCMRTRSVSITHPMPSSIWSISSRYAHQHLDFPSRLPLVVRLNTAMKFSILRKAFWNIRQSYAPYLALGSIQSNEVAYNA